ncbi:aquaporin-like protein [Obba rivulosa]|uniref:Aquaporin-like protein n=1 Tax=Obba rivulosa TaxID=1052685 RepID=A0A8E2B2X1_9APHY|nr:aquaporin-like protein [Obba rivulosa]
MSTETLTPAGPLVHLNDLVSRPRFLLSWERQRRHVHWAIEMIAEGTGTFFYTYAGIGSTATWICGTILGVAGLGSLFQVGIAYAIGVIMSLAVCLSTSMGHFNPGFTIHAILYKKCTPLKGLRMIIAQIIGAYIACMLAYIQYKNLLIPAEEVLKEKGLFDKQMFTAQGPAGVFALYVTPTDNFAYVFLNEFVCDVVIALVAFACMEPTNFLCPPTMMPWIIAFSYAVVIWGYSPAGLAANSARDVGGRLAALTIWGSQASGGRYAAISALTNIPATLLASIFYETVFNDGSRTVTPAYYDWIVSMRAQRCYIKNGGASYSETDGLSYTSTPELKPVSRNNSQA